MPDLLFTNLGPVVFIGFWAMVCYSSSKMAGWDSMAEPYPLRTPYSGKQFTMETVRVGKSKYKGAITLGPNPIGLYIDILFIFQWWHPPLFIPWSDIVHVPVSNNDKKEELSFPFLNLQLKQNPDVELLIAKNPGKPLKISHKLAQSVAAASAGAFKLDRPKT